MSSNLKDLYTELDLVSPSQAHHSLPSTFSVSLFLSFPPFFLIISFTVLWADLQVKRSLSRVAVIKHWNKAT